MKTKLFFVLCMAIVAVSFGQNETTVQKSQEENSLEVRITTPQFYWNKEASKQLQGNHSLLIKSYLNQNMEYPETALRCNIQGTEVVRFTVSSKGEVTNITVVNSISPEIDEETIRVLKTTSGKWIPGFRNGIPLEMSKEIALFFQIGGNNASANKEIREKATIWFKKGSKSLVSQKNPGKAAKYFDKALKCLPYEKNILYLRGMARLLMNDKDGAKQDFDRMSSLDLVDINGEKITQNITKAQSCQIADLNQN